MVSNVNTGLYVTGVPVSKAALNANMLVIKNEIEALQNGQLGPSLVSKLNSQLGTTAWQSGGGTLTNAQIVAGITAELGSTVWQSGGGTLTNAQIVAGITNELGSSTWQLGSSTLTNAQIVAAITAELGSTTWQTGGTTLTGAQIVAAITTELTSSDWQRPTLSHAGFSDISSIYDPIADPGTHALISCNANAVNIVLPNTSGIPDGVGFIANVNSNNNPVSISCAVSGQLRSTPFMVDPDFNQDANQVFVGASQELQRNAYVCAYKKSSVWRVLGHLRSLVDSDVTAIKFGANNERAGAQTLEQKDQRIKIVWDSGGDVYTIPFLDEGSQFQIKNISTVAGTLAATGTNVEFDLRNARSTSTPLLAGSTAVMDMRRGSTVIDISKDL